MRVYSTFSSKDPKDSKKSPAAPAVVYQDAFSMKKQIIKENKGKAGIYMWTNRLRGDIYVGQSVDLSTKKEFLVENTLV